MSEQPVTDDRPARSATSPWRQIVLMALPLALAWGAAFWVTGMLWWRAPQPADEPLQPPAAAQVHGVDTDWVNMDLYKRSNPQWRP